MGKSTKSEQNRQHIIKSFRPHLPPYYGVFYVAAFVISAAALFLVLNNVVLPYKREIQFNFLNSIFLSQHAVFWTAVFFGLASLSVMLKVKMFNGILKRTRGVVLVLTVFCSIVYHGYLQKTPEIRSYARNIKHFDTYMFMQHGLCAILMLIDLALSSYHQQKLCFFRNIMPLCVYIGLYVTYITLAYQNCGVWPYAFMNRFSIEQLCVFIFASVLAAVLTLGVFATVSHFIVKIAHRRHGAVSAEISDKMHDLAHQTRAVKSYINSKVHDISATARREILPKGIELSHMVQQKAADFASAGTSKAKKVFDNVEHKAEQVAKRVKDSVIGTSRGKEDDDSSDDRSTKSTASKRSTSSRASDAKDSASSKASDTKSAALSKATSVKDAVLNKMSEAKDTIMSKAAVAKDLAMDKASDAKSAISAKAVELKNAAVDKAAQLKSSAQDKAADVKSTVSDKAADVKKVAAAKSTDAKNSVQEKGQEMKATVESKAEQAAKSAKSMTDDLIAKAAGKTAEVADKVSKKAHEVENKKKK